MRLLAVIVIAVATAFAQSGKSKLLTSETLFEMESISSPHISPDGGTVVFTRSFTDQMKDQALASTQRDWEREKAYKGLRDERDAADPYGLKMTPEEKAKSTQDRAYILGGFGAPRLYTAGKGSVAPVDTSEWGDDQLADFRSRYFSGISDPAHKQRIADLMGQVPLQPLPTGSKL